MSSSSSNVRQLKGEYHSQLLKNYRGEPPSESPSNLYIFLGSRRKPYFKKLPFLLHTEDNGLGFRGLGFRDNSISVCRTRLDMGMDSNMRHKAVKALCKLHSIDKGSSRTYVSGSPFCRSIGTQNKRSITRFVEILGRIQCICRQQDFLGRYRGNRPLANSDEHGLRHSTPMSPCSLRCSCSSLSGMLFNSASGLKGHESFHVHGRAEPSPPSNPQPHVTTWSCALAPLIAAAYHFCRKDADAPGIHGAGVPNYHEVPERETWRLLSSSPSTLRRSREGMPFSSNAFTLGPRGL